MKLAEIYPYKAKGQNWQSLLHFIPTIAHVCCWTLNRYPFPAQTCPSLDAPEHGSLIGSNFTFKQSASFTCEEGYFVNGSTSRTCQGDGIWSGTQPVCQSKYVCHRSVLRKVDYKFGGNTSMVAHSKLVLLAIKSAIQNRIQCWYLIQHSICTKTTSREEI